MLEFDDTPDTGQPNIKVVGVGGGGGNSVNTMIEAGIQGVDFIAVNTDCQVLGANQAPTKMQIGGALTKGLGAGANPEMGAAAALEDGERLAEALSGADMVFVTAGMGGGTGTGAAPVVAEIARDQGALTVGVVTKPFGFEGLQRKKRATQGIGLLAKAVDALIVIPNDRLLGVAGQKTSLKDAFTLVDAVCLNAVRGISDLVMVPGLINVDFADVRTIMTGTGRALMGTGRACGENRALEAAKLAINSPLLEDVSINGATGILVNITGSSDLTLAEVNEACSLVQEAADPDCNIIFGSVIDANAGDELRITVIATGFQPGASATETPRNGGSNPRRRGDQQMALPIDPGAAAQAGAPGATPVQPQSPESTDRWPNRLGADGEAGGAQMAREGRDTSVTMPAQHNPVSSPSPHREAVQPYAPVPQAHQAGQGHWPPGGHDTGAGYAHEASAPAPHAAPPVPAPRAPNDDAFGFEPVYPAESAPNGHAPVAYGPGAADSTPGEWGAAEAPPIIRPQARPPAPAAHAHPVRTAHAEAPLAGHHSAPPAQHAAQPAPRAPQPHTPWPGVYALPAHQAMDEDLGIEDSEYDKPTFMRRRATQEPPSAPHAAPGRYREG